MLSNTVYRIKYDNYIPNIFNPPKSKYSDHIELNNHFKNITEKHIGLLIGKNGKHFISITQKNKLEYIWYFKNDNKIGLWGNNKQNIENSKNEIIKRVSNILIKLLNDQNEMNNKSNSVKNESEHVNKNENLSQQLNLLLNKYNHEKRFEKFAIKYFSNISNDYVIDDWFNDIETAWKKYEESEQKEWFIFKKDNNIFRENPILIKSSFPDNEKIKYNLNPIPRRSMIKMTSCMVCNRLLPKINEFNNHEITTRDICWEIDPTPLYTYCRYNKKCEKIVYNQIIKMANENNILPISWVLIDMLNKKFIDNYVKFYDNMYGINCEKISIPRSNETISNGKFSYNKEKCFFITNNKLKIYVEFKDSNTNTILRKKVDLGILVNHNKNSTILQSFDNYFSKYNNFNKLKDSLKF